MPASITNSAQDTHLKIRLDIIRAVLIPTHKSSFEYFSPLAYFLYVDKTLESLLLSPLSMIHSLLTLM